MKINQLMLFGIFFIGISTLEAQEKTSLTLDGVMDGVMDGILT